jgi:hypothetical protein
VNLQQLCMKLFCRWLEQTHAGTRCCVGALWVPIGGGGAIGEGAPHSTMHGA